MTQNFNNPSTDELNVAVYIFDGEQPHNVVCCSMINILHNKLLVGLTLLFLNGKNNISNMEENDSY